MPPAASPRPPRCPLGTNEARVDGEAGELPALVASALTCDGCGKKESSRRGGALPSGQLLSDTYTRGRRESAAQLGGLTGPPPRAAAPLSPKALSHEEAPYPSFSTPSTRPHARRHVTRAPPGTRAHGWGRGEGPAVPAEAARGPLATAALTAAPPSPAPAGGGQLLRQWERHEDGVALRDGRTGRRAADRLGEGRRHVGTIFAASRSQRRTRGRL